VAKTTQLSRGGGKELWGKGRGIVKGEDAKLFQMNEGPFRRGQEDTRVVTLADVDDKKLLGVGASVRTRPRPHIAGAG